MSRRRGRPPRLAEWLLAVSVPPEDRDAVLGDLDEAFAEEGPSSRRFPRLWYWAQALLFAASFTLERVRGRGARPSAPRDRIRQDRLGMGELMHGWLKELRVAGRALGRKPGFSATCVLTLALGIGANAAIFSVVNGVLLRPLDLPDADRIVWISEWWREQSNPGGSSMNAANFQDLRATLGSLESMTPYVSSSVNLSGDGPAARARALLVGHEFLGALGVQPLLGRDFALDDDVPDAPDVAILSHVLWRDRFGADRDLLGRAIQLDGASYDVVGVLPEHLEFPGSPEVLLPLGFERGDHARGGRQLNGVARLAEGATIESAQTEITGAYARLAEAYPEQNENWSAWVEPLQNLVVRRSQKEALGLLGWAVGLVFVITCLNLVNLLLVRAETRQRELVVRMALGAGKARLMPYFVGEALILSLAGAAGGILVAYLGVQAMKSAFGGMLPRPDAIGLDPTVLGFALALAVVAGLFGGLAPMMRMSADDLQRDLREGARGVSGGGSRLRNTLVIGELALAVVLLANTGLLVKSFYRVARVDIGVEAPERVLVAQMSLPPGRYDDPAARARFVDQMVTEVSGLPGIESVGVTNRLPLYGGTNFTRVPVVGDPERFASFVEWRTVTPGFFDAVGVRLEEGRMLGPEELASDTLRALLATRELVRQLFGASGGLGQRIDMYGDGVGMEIIGIVSDVRDLGHERPPPPGVYAGYSPATANGAVILLARSQEDPMLSLPPLREALARLDPDLPLYGTRTLEDVVDQRLGGRRFSIALLMVFAGLAVFLGAIGIYGVMSYAVAQRTRELGVRLALGAKRGAVLSMVLASGVRLTAVGLVLGLGGAFLATRLVSAQLFGVGVADPMTYVAVAAILGTVAMLATYVPARRASGTDPLEALRHE